jgi:glyoxylase I family protein
MADFVPPAHNNVSPFADMRGRHVAVRAPNLAEAKEFYVGKLDFRVVAEWPFADEQLAYLAPPTDDHFWGRSTRWRRNASYGGTPIYGSRR